MHTPNQENPIIWRIGKKTLLRPVQESDLPAFQAAINNQEAQKYVLRTSPVSQPDQQKWYEHVSQSNPNNITVAVCSLDNELLGNMAIKFDPATRSAVTGSLLFPDKCGKGYGTDAKMQLLAYAFFERDVRKVVSTIIGYNVRSRRYAKKCGYRFTARIPAEHFRSGKWRSEVIYTAWKKEWLEYWKQYQAKT